MNTKSFLLFLGFSCISTFIFSNKSTTHDSLNPDKIIALNSIPNTPDMKWIGLKKENLPSDDWIIAFHKWMQNHGFAKTKQ